VPSGNPQLEHGYAAIANEVLDAIARTSLSDYESRCIHYLWRKTYGYRNNKTGKAKKDDVISYSQWTDGTALDRRNVGRTLDKLVERHIIYRQAFSLPGKNITIVYAFNKHYQEWAGYEPPSIKEEPAQPTLFAETTVEAKPLSLETTVPSQPSSPMTTDEAKVSSVETTVTVQVSSLPPKVSSVETIEVSSVETNTISNISNTISKEEEGDSSKKKKEPKPTLKEIVAKYALEIAGEFPGLDLNEEQKAFWLWWEDGNKTVKKPRLAFRNWCNIAKEKKISGKEKKDNNNGAHGGYSQKTGYAKLPTTEELLESWSFAKPSGPATGGDGDVPGL
jgi:phage replication O-like protein O